MLLKKSAKTLTWVDKEKSRANEKKRREAFLQSSLTPTLAARAAFRRSPQSKRLEQAKSGFHRCTIFFSEGVGLRRFLGF